MHTPKTDKTDDYPRAWNSLACQLRLWIVLAVVLAADLISKQVLRDAIGWGPGETPTRDKFHTVVPGLLEFRWSWNTGAALGLLSGYVPVFIVVGVVALAVFLAFFARSHRRQWFFQAGIALVLAGALGNIYDRVAFGQVRDFIHVTAQPHVELFRGWPQTGLYPYIFNVADAALVVGVAMIMLSSMYRARAGLPANQNAERQRGQRGTEKEGSERGKGGQPRET